MQQKDSERLEKLITLAQESTFEGERVAAYAAAERMAAKLGWNLDDARHYIEGIRKSEAAAHASHSSDDPFDWGWDFFNAKRPKTGSSPFFNPSEAAASRERQNHRLEEEKREREKAALRAMRMHQAQMRRHNTKRSPKDFARILIQETSFPLREIAYITGLEMHELIRMKLLMRPAHTNSAASA